MSQALDHTARVLAQPIAGGRFEILEMLGRGGMGEVYKAWDRELELTVALKSLRAKHAGDPRILSRFKREAKLARRIKHVNVAQIYDLVDILGTPHLSMEFVDGKSLRDLLDSKRSLPLNVTLAILEQSCRGVQAAHDAGVIHRDLKPHNVMIARKDGRACVLDFGIAREVVSCDETEAGVILGSPQYMSYEQLAGLPITPSSDVYQLGMLAYELLTGISPFRAPGAAPSTLRAMREVPPDPRNHDRNLPDFVATAILKCLSRNPSYRPQSAAEFASLLRRTAQPAVTGDAAAPQLELDPGTVTLCSSPSVLLAMAPGPEREVLAEKLERLGCTVKSCNDGLAALDAAHASSHTLVILAAGLSQVDGLTACQLLRRTPHGAKSKVLLLLGNGDPQRELFAREVGADDVLRGPLNVHAFSRAVRNLLRA